MPPMPTLSPDLAPALAAMAEQAEAVTAGHPGLPEGEDAIPASQRAAWRRILLGLAKGEGIEEWAVEPIARGLAHAGFDEGSVLRFFRTQGVDELRHRDLFLGYIARHWELPAEATPILAHQLLYDGLFKLIIAQSERHPLRLLMPLLAYEKTVSAYATRLIALLDPGMPRLAAVLKSVRIDEARHVAGVGMTCRALIAARRPDPIERAFLAGLCRMVIADMDRAAWWKPGLKECMAAIGFDTASFAGECEGAMRELEAILEGR